MTDPFLKNEKGLTTPADMASAIVPTDFVDLPVVPRAIFVGVAGDIVATIGGVDITFKNLANGQILPIRPSRVKATGTTATFMIAMW